MSLPNGLELRFHPKEKLFPDWYSEERGDCQHPCFLATGPYETSNGEEFYCEQYQFYFRENLAIGLHGVSTKSKALGTPAVLKALLTHITLGYHKHDVEGIHVLFEKADLTPRRVYFKAHGVGQGIWKEWGECEKNSEGALVVYIAWGSHATYPSAKSIPRVMGLANDRTGKGGRRISVKTEHCIPAAETKLANGVHLYATIQQVAERSITSTERFLLPFVEKKLAKKARKLFKN